MKILITGSALLDHVCMKRSKISIACMVDKVRPKIKKQKTFFTKFIK